MTAENADQARVFAFLSEPATHGLREPVIRIDTHGASVFLAGKDVYKVKRAVRFPFMDFSTLEKRRLACEAEIEANTRNAPDLYLGVVPISREDNHLTLGNGEEIIEWAVHLRRFDENQTLDRLAAQGPLEPNIATQLGEIVAAAHRKAPVFHDRRATATLRAQIIETARGLADARDVFPAGAAARLESALLAAFDDVAPLLLRREASGDVRRCHGDLHLRNIVMIGDAPVLFDALEFDEKLAICDSLYDLAFLLMDLWTRGHFSEANLVMNRYLSVSDSLEVQLGGLKALPVFLSLRAAIRARVATLEPSPSPETIASARLLFAAAGDFLAFEAPLLVAIGGRSGTGKTQLARRLATAIGRPPGAVHFRSDVERKRMFGALELERLPQEAYRAEASGPVYSRLDALAALTLETGQSVIIDAAFFKESERADAAAAKVAGGKFLGLWLDAPLEARLERVSARHGDASDAGPQVALAQEAVSLGEINWIHIDAAQPPELVAQAALAAITAT
ncbi:AAA family ATPase [Methylocella silvestris]|uniref:Aminoglycoside phosphotransferase n=1 Tax=Methylocella silvestris TaxID=199596 RepID=A0A2J7TH28_METSI|nr:AAA family ATPase [Methylocella silvestris]PNG26080.1 aminoglycoside phosphotransferase [Methylocella silvestris]